MSSRLFVFVAGSLTCIALVCLAGVIYLAANELSIPDVLVATTGAAVGALGSLLAGRGTAPGP